MEFMLQPGFEAFMLQSLHWMLYLKRNLYDRIMCHFCLSLITRLILFILPVMLSFPSMALAEGAGRLVSGFGEVMVSAGEKESWRPIKSGESLLPGTVIRTGRLSGASLLLQDESLIRLSQNTQFEIQVVRSSSFWRDASAAVGSLKEAVRTRFRLLSGKLWGRNNNTDVDAEISTLTATFGVRGTEFTIESSDSSSTLTVHEGKVLAKSSSKELTVNPGEQAIVPKDKAPQKSMAKDARNTVQWTVELPDLVHVRIYLKDHVDNKVAAAGIYEAMKKKITPML